jgi:hypothetical protein
VVCAKVTPPTPQMTGADQLTISLSYWKEAAGLIHNVKRPPG